MARAAERPCDVLTCCVDSSARCEHSPRSLGVSMAPFVNSLVKKELVAVS